ncbi:hypothetical protein RBB80_13370 [Tunturiibacter gelidiferens]
MKKATVRGKTPKKTWPGFEADERDRGDVDCEDVGKEEDFVVAAGGEEKRGCEGSRECVGGKDLAVLRPGHVGVPCGDQNHGAESYAGG